MLIPYTFPFEIDTLFPELDLIWLIRVKGSLARQMNSNISAFDDMFFPEFFEHVAYVQQKIEEEKIEMIKRRSGGA